MVAFLRRARIGRAVAPRTLRVLPRCSALGLAFLALDEMLALHETIGYNLDFLADLPGVNSPEDVVFALYAVPAVAFFVVYRDLLAVSRWGIRLVALGVALFGVAAVLDVADADRGRAVGRAARRRPCSWPASRWWRCATLLACRRMRATPDEIGRRLRERDRSAAPAALNLIEDRTPRGREATAELLAEVSPAALGGEAPAHLIGVTGPPGAGKSSLLSCLVGVWRERGRTVAVLAVDPSSKRSGGALLGDRARIEHDPHDDGVLIRSTAAGGRLGGLAAPTREAAEALAAAFDVVVVETVGVGQSETDVEEVCDTVAVVVQPGSGDVLQFLKAGIMEVPDVLVVTKADLGAPADRARRDLQQARGRGGRRQRAGAGRVVASHRRPAWRSWPTRSRRTASASTRSARRPRARRLSALRELTAEHGERALRAWAGAARRSACSPTRTRGPAPPSWWRCSRRRSRPEARPPDRAAGRRGRRSPRWWRSSPARPTSACRWASRRSSSRSRSWRSSAAAEQLLGLGQVLRRVHAAHERGGQRHVHRVERLDGAR